MNDDEVTREFETYKEFWTTIMDAVNKETGRGVPVNHQLLRKLFFLSGLLQASSDMIKVFIQEMYPSFTPELQEKVDRELNILMRQIGTENMKGMARDPK